MVIGGLQRFSLSDFPGMISAIVFTRGCSFRCAYCHNPELVDPSRYAEEFPLNEVRDFLRSRRGWLQGVVVSGGEPTLHADLPEFLRELKHMDFAVKLDTNGTKPLMIQRLVAERLVDFIAMDIKAPLASYEHRVNAAVDTSAILRSIELIIASGLPHEFRTTCLDTLPSTDDFLSIAQLVKGCDQYVLQPFRGGKVLDPSMAAGQPPDESRLARIAETLSAAGIAAKVR
ncbi:MAG: anaerobic ribonucleoside-triphosphate reductase activating protein [Spirochaetia bacterium]